MEQKSEKSEKSEDKKSKFLRWFKRVGVVGFLFFFIKGLVWIGIFIWAGRCATQ